VVHDEPILYTRDKGVGEREWTGKTVNLFPILRFPLVHDERQRAGNDSLLKAGRKGGNLAFSGLFPFGQSGRSIYLSK
jgi:hypothetical protein